MGEIGKLPSDYTEVEYIANTSEAFIATNYAPQRYDEIYMRFMIDTDESAMKSPFSAGTSTHQLALYTTRRIQNGEYCFSFYYKYFASGSATVAETHISPYTWTDMTINQNGHMECNGRSADSIYTGDLAGEKVLKLFCGADTGAPFIGRISKFYIRRDGEYKLFLIPCIRNSDDKAGFYDTVSDTFYSAHKDSEGDFIAGGVKKSDFTFNNAIIRVLPAEYQQVEYLETISHTSKIDTGVAGNDSTLKFEFEWAMLGSPYPDSSWYGPFGNLAASGMDCWGMRRGNATNDTGITSLIVYLGNTNAATFVYPFGEGVSFRWKRFKVEMEYGKATITSSAGITMVTSEKSSLEATSENIYIGTTSRISSGIATCHGRLWYFKIWSQGQLIRDYIPCYRKSDNKAGLYDAINNTFNPSIGSTEFIAGGIVTADTTSLEMRRRQILLNTPHLVDSYSDDTDYYGQLVNERGDYPILTIDKGVSGSAFRELTVGFTAYQERRRNLLGSYYFRGLDGNIRSDGGITYTHNPDGSVTANGTVDSSNSGDSTCYSDVLRLPAGNYYYSMGDLRNAHADFRQCIVWDDTSGARAKRWDGTTNIDPLNVFATGLVEQFKIEANHNYRICCRVKHLGTVADNFTFYPSIFTADETDFSFEPFAGYKEISGIGSKFSCKQVGKNLFGVTKTKAGQSFVVSGITFDVNDDGTITANGTASGSDSAVLNNIFENLPAGKYLASAGPLSSGMSPYIWDFTTGQRAKAWDGTTNFDFKQDGSFEGVILEKGHVYSFSVRITRGATANNATFYPMICSATETDSTYEPYVEYDSFEYTTTDTIGVGDLDFQTGEFSKARQVIKVPSDAATKSRITSINSTNVLGLTTFWYYWAGNEGVRDAGYDVNLLCDLLHPDPNTQSFVTTQNNPHMVRTNDTYRTSLFMSYPTSQVGTTTDSIIAYLKEHPFYIVTGMETPIDETRSEAMHKFKLVNGKQNFIFPSDCLWSAEYWSH